MTMPNEGRTAVPAEFASAVLDSSTQYSIIATDAAGVILLWNEGARLLYGYTASEILGSRVACLHRDQDVRTGLLQGILDGAHREGNWAGTVNQRRQDGTGFIARVVATPRYSAGELSGFLVIASDSTDQVRRLHDVEDARVLAGSLLEAAPDAMVFVDDGGLIRLANAETENLFGFDRDELVGSSIEMLIPERYHGRHPKLRSGFFEHPCVRPMGAGPELWGRRKDGVEFPVEISLSPLETEDGLLATAVIRDITERRHVAAQLQAAIAALEAANRAKDGFLARMSHDLRTPLNAILGFTGTLLMELPGPLTDDQRKQLRTVQANSRHLLLLINDLLDLAKIESGKIEVSVEPIDCRELLEEIEVGLRPLSAAKGITIHVQAPEAPLEVHSDRRVLSQILINLTNNAIKFTDAGAVRLTVRSSGERVRFSVTDTGCGIKPEDQQRLFTAFEQIDASAIRPSEGTGLGLYICQRLAAPIGAVIGLESEFGSGSEFRLELASGPKA
jgi:protein-histidine pros-kinase